MTCILLREVKVYEYFTSLDKTNVIFIQTIVELNALILSERSFTINAENQYVNHFIPIFANPITNIIKTSYVFWFNWLCVFSSFMKKCFNVLMGI